jgi:hypothetical protein
MYHAQRINKNSQLSYLIYQLSSLIYRLSSLIYHISQPAPPSQLSASEHSVLLAPPTPPPALHLLTYDSDDEPEALVGRAVRVRWAEVRDVCSLFGRSCGAIISSYFFLFLFLRVMLTYSPLAFPSNIFHAGLLAQRASGVLQCGTDTHTVHYDEDCDDDGGGRAPTSRAREGAHRLRDTVWRLGTVTSTLETIV